jgi:hypothetical protein
MRFSRRQGISGTRRAALVAVVLTAGTMTSGLLVQSSGAGASSAPKGMVTVGSKTYKMSFVSCLGSSSHVQTAMGAGGNTVEITGKIHNAKYTDVIIGVTITGKPALLVAPNSGTAKSSGGTFKGKSGSTNVKGSYTC